MIYLKTKWVHRKWHDLYISQMWHCAALVALMWFKTGVSSHVSVDISHMKINVSTNSSSESTF